MVSINFSTRGAAIHRPRIDDFPVYARVDNDIQELSNRTDKWKANTEKIYNSPTNIRRVYFTYKGIYVNYYQPVKGGDKYLKAGIGSTNLKEIIIKNSYNKDYKFSGCYLTAITNPWVCSNIEEIYFDWSMFMSSDVLNLGFGDLLRESLSSFNGSNNGIDLKVIQILFARYCMNSNEININELKERFPRLKVVGYIRDLENIYTSLINKPGKKGIEDFILPWCIGVEEIKKSLAQRTSTLWLLPDANKFISKAIIRDNTYKFDRDILANYFKNLNEYYRQNKPNTEVNKDTDKELIKEIEPIKEAEINKEIEVNTIKQDRETIEFERILNSILNNFGTKVCKDAVYIALRHTSKDERINIYNSLSDKYKQLYNDVFSIEAGD